MNIMPHNDPDDHYWYWHRNDDGVALFFLVFIPFLILLICCAFGWRWWGDERRTRKAQCKMRVIDDPYFRVNENTVSQ